MRTEAERRQHIAEITRAMAAYHVQELGRRFQIAVDASDGEADWLDIVEGFLMGLRTANDIRIITIWADEQAWTMFGRSLDDMRSVYAR